MLPLSRAASILILLFLLLVDSKGGYVSAASTFTVKLACVSFYNNLKKDLPPGSGIFIVVDASTGAPLGIFQENRAMTDLRTGVSVGRWPCRLRKYALLLP